MRTPAPPQADSFAAFFRDLALRVAGLGVVAVAALWLAELPAAQDMPGVAGLPHLRDCPLLDQLPSAPQVFGQPEPVRQARPVVAAKRLPGVLEPPAAPGVAPPAEPPQPAPATAAAAEVALAPVPPKAPPVARSHSAGGAVLAHRQVQGVPVQLAIIDLQDPSVVGTLVLANGASHPNVSGDTVGDEDFTAMVKRTRAAVAINGTFFSKDDEKRVMGNMVRDGALVKFSQWDHDGTTFWLGAGNRPGMTTPCDEAAPPWKEAWLALSCGPRLLRGGKPWLKPAREGFKDPHVLGLAGRSALGYDAAGQHLYLVSFEAAVALEQEAEVMRAIGCFEAMNLDGGASRAIAQGPVVVVAAGRRLTNVLAFYDRHHPAPAALLTGFMKFQAGEP